MVGAPIGVDGLDLVELGEGHFATLGEVDFARLGEMDFATGGEMVPEPVSNVGDGGMGRLEASALSTSALLHLACSLSNKGPNISLATSKVWSNSGSTNGL